MDSTTLIERAQADPLEMPAILAELARLGTPDADESAVEVACVELERSVPTLVAWLSGEARAWAAALLSSLVTRPDIGALPVLDRATTDALVSALGGQIGRDVALVLLSLGIETTRARDVLVETVGAELDETDRDPATGRWPYDTGCALQDVVLALRNAPVSDPMLALLDRVVTGADGPLWSVCATSLIRPGVPPELPSRWHARLESLEFSIEHYSAARRVEVETALALAEGQPVPAIVEHLVARPEPRVFVEFAIWNSLNALADHAHRAVTRALNAAIDGATAPAERERLGGFVAGLTRATDDAEPNLE